MLIKTYIKLFCIIHTSKLIKNYGLYTNIKMLHLKNSAKSGQRYLIMFPIIKVVRWRCGLH